MDNIIVKSLVNAENTHIYPSEFTYSTHTQSNNTYEILALHYKNVIRAISDIGGHSVLTNYNVIVCCTNHTEFTRPALGVDQIHHNVIYSDKNYYEMERYITDFRNFYGDISTVLKFLAPFKMLSQSPDPKQMLPQDCRHVIEHYNNGVDRYWLDIAIKNPHLVLHNNLKFHGDLITNA